MKTKKEKLKTLKDYSKLRLYRSKSCQLLSRQLKAEAVKWFKKFDGDYMRVFLQLWIKEFFNLTLEDLEETEK